MAPAFHLPKQKCVRRLIPKTRRGTIVGTIKTGSAFLLIACPPGEMRKNGKCKVGTQAVEMIKAARRGKCPAGFKRR